MRGASEGEGLGNQFLSHIREVDAVAYVLRCFEDPDVTHVEGRIDPIADADTVETELMLADLESLERRREPLQKKAKSGEKDAEAQLALIDKALALVREGRPARQAQLSLEEERPFRQLQLLTAKPVLYVCNVDEASIGGNALSDKVGARARAEGAGSVAICAKIEAELASLSEQDRQDYLAHLGLVEPGLNQLIREGYRLLDLITFFTAGPKEARAWTVPAGTKAPRAAGAIHTDFERGFIRAETIAYDDYVAMGGELGAKEAGKMRLEGKEYVVRTATSCCFALPTEPSGGGAGRQSAASVLASKKCRRSGLTASCSWSCALALGGGIDGGHHGILADADVEQDLGAQLLDHLDPGIEGETLGIAGVGNVQVLGPDPQHQLPSQVRAQALGLSPGISISSPAFLAVIRPLPSAMVTAAKFIAGEPMKPATNLLAGRL